MGSASSGLGRACPPVACLLAVLVLLVPGPAPADPAYRGPLLYGLDPVIRATDDPRLLGVDRLVLLRRLETLGVRPSRDGAVRPTLRSALKRRFDERSNVDLERRESVLEYNDALDLATRIEYPAWFYLFPAAETLPGGFLYYPPRRLAAPGVDLFVDDISGTMARRHGVQRKAGRVEKLSVVGAGKRAQDDDGLINLTIPIKLPRTLEKIIGRGEKTRIKISGRERIAITGESTVVKPFTPTERVSSQSLFPSLDMEQELQINLSGTIGEKIILEVDHNSAAIGPDATKIKLMYQGTEDEIIKTIETGDVGLTLPGSQLLGYSSNKSGLFGVKVTGQVGRADFTVVASKQKAESSSKTFNSKGGSAEPKRSLSHQFINNRFFRLVNGRETGAIDPSWRIDRTSIQIYKRTSLTGGAGADEINNVAVYVDSTGTWEVYADGAEPYEKGAVWQRLEFDLQQDVIEETASGRLYAIDLGSGITDTDYLAVTYRYVDAEGDEVLQIGDDPSRDPFAPQRTVPGEDELYYAMKLLKAPASRKEPTSHDYVLRNIYSLGGSNIDPTTFVFAVERIDPTTNNPELDEQDVPYIEIFGLDTEDEQGNPGADGKVDYHRPELFDLQRGLLKFPVDVPQPFAPADPQAFYEGNVTGDDWTYDGSTYLVENQVPLLYDVETLPTRYQDYGRFQLVATHAAVSSNFSLGASNIEEGSETVTVDGRVLTKGVDYEIDYLFGEITLKGEAANLTPDSQVSVTYQYAPFFGGGNTSLLGLNLGYDLGRESKVATTMLYQTESIVGERAKLGEEPSKTLVGNLNLTHTVKPGILTDIANILSRRDSERESSLQFSGEVAASLPNPNTKGVAYLEDFEGVDASDIVPLTRTSWSWASRPFLGARWRQEQGDLRDFVPEERAEVRWFLPKDRVPRRWLNPDLVNQERDETQQVMEMWMRAGEGGWQDGTWAGIMRGISRTGLDLSRSQFVEIWINDGEQLPSDRSGRLHIDFGSISEDGFWPTTPEGALVVGQFEREDGINGTTPDGIYTPDEDIGLDGRGEDGPQRYSAEYVSASNPYPNINGTAGNTRLDTEDLNGDDQLNRLDGYFTATIDLAETPALVDVVRDYVDLDDIPADQAWRKYRIALGALDSVAVNTSANLEAVTHVRIWYENDEPGAPDTKRIQLSEFRFLGSRWERQGIRRVGDEALLTPADLVPGEEFFLGEVNNKENPDFAAQLPFAPRVEGNIPEKEQALVLDYQNLERGHLMRASKQVSVRGDDYTQYGQMTWYWYNPSHESADVDLFFRVGADTLNYYEVAYNYADQHPGKQGWQFVTIDLKELSNVKNAPYGDDGVRRAVLEDARGSGAYDVAVVGRPDLRSVKRYYFGVANRRISTPVSGYVYFNDIKLEGVKREMGMAQRAGVRLNMADVVKVDFDWNHRDPEFHGLDQRQGSQVDNTDWNLSTNFAVDDFIPLLGFRLPVSLTRRQTIQRPKYEVNSDIEIIEQDVRNEMSTLEEREGFSTRLSHSPSKAAVLRYVIDPWAVTLAGSRSWRSSPTDLRNQKSLQGSLSYDLRISGRYTFGRYPLLGLVPVLKGLSFVPAKVAFGGQFSSSQTSSSTIAEDGTVTQRPTTRTRPASLNAGIDYEPLSIVSLSASAKSDRDMLRPEEHLGVNIGEENRRNYDLRMTVTPPRPVELGTSGLLKPVRTLVRQVNSLRPSMQFTGGFADDHSPGLRQEGDPPDIRSISNNHNWEFRFSVPVGDAVKKLVPERRYTEDERQRLIRQQRQREQQAARRGGASIELTPEETEGLTPAQIQELREQRLLEAAEAAAEQERLEAEARGETPDEGEGGGGPGLRGALDFVLSPLREMTPVKITWTDKKTSAYARYTGDVPFWYKTGLKPEIAGADSQSVSYATQDRKALNVATTTKLGRAVSLDVKYGKTTAERDQSAAVTESYQQDWPDVQVSVSGMERWPLLGGADGSPDSGWFRSSNLNVSYKRTRTVNNYTSTLYNPSTTWNLSPRWTGTFHSGLTATLTFNRSADTQVNNSVITTRNRTRVGLQLRHKFRAQRLLARLGLYRPGSSPTIDMDVDLSWETDRTARTNPGGLNVEPTGTTRYSVNPRFSYQVTRNLSGALRFIFSRSANIASGQSTTTLGLGLEATFVF